MIAAQTIEAAKDYLRFAWDLVAGKRQAAELSAAATRQEEISPYLDLNQPRTILDLGSGSLRPQITILAAQGHNAIGIDFVNSPAISLKSLLYGFARALYRWRLPGTSHRAPCIIYGDVTHLPLADSSVDLVTSMAAFEHFLEIPKVLAEVRRVLKPGGVVWISLHPFTSLSGGHNVSCRLGTLDDLPKGIDAWDHLRERKLPFTVPLNEWRNHQYVEAVSAQFEIVLHGGIGREGEALLTPLLRSELSGYTDEELLSVSYRIVARRT